MIVFFMLIWPINLQANSVQNKEHNHSQNYVPNNMIVKLSTNNVGQTMDRLEKILKDKGVTVFLRIDHTKGAKKVGVDLRPTQLLIFGNPKLGSPLMQSNQSIAIDLPLKAIVWQDDLGKVWLAYNKPSYLGERFHIKNRDKVIEKMTGVLNKLTNYAIGK